MLSQRKLRDGVSHIMHLRHFIGGLYGEGAGRLGLAFPLTPVRRTDIDPLPCRRVYPSIKDAAPAREGKGVLA
jgi:hypothetical protein